MKLKPRLVFVLIVVFQLLILLGMIGFKEATLTTGTEVVLQTAPVDPRDIFRGDYVALSYKISTINSNVQGYYGGLGKVGDKAYLHLEQRGDVWEATGISREYEKEWPVFIVGEITNILPKQVTLKYGIEVYFVPEDKGLEIQRARDLKVRVSVDGFGKAVIKGLIVDGTPFQLR
jgi:uncharacterized membrane-anchored protein